MSQQPVNVGVVANDGTGDPLRTAFTKLNANIAELVAIAEGPAYIVNNWYVPYQVGSFSGGANPGANLIRAFPGYIRQTCTINALGGRIGTAAVGNIQFAIYAHSVTTGKPTGNALASTGSISTNANPANGAVNVQLQPGLYWFASNIDNASAIFVSLSGGGGSCASEVVGSQIQAEVLTATAGLNGWSFAQAFGTWPDLTAGAFTAVQGNTMPVVQFKVASVP